MYADILLLPPLDTAETLCCNFAPPSKSLLDKVCTCPNPLVVMASELTGIASESGPVQPTTHNLQDARLRLSCSLPYLARNAKTITMGS